MGRQSLRRTRPSRKATETKKSTGNSKNVAKTKVKKAPAKAGKKSPPKKATLKVAIAAKKKVAPTARRTGRPVEQKTDVKLQSTKEKAKPKVEATRRSARQQKKEEEKMEEEGEEETEDDKNDTSNEDIEAETEEETETSQVEDESESGSESEEDDDDDDDEGGSEPDDGEVEAEDDSDFDPDNDPDRLWCFCKKPHGNRFMICCDKCEEWFHGDCVGVSMAKGREMEKTGEEWCCKVCRDKKEAQQEKKAEFKSPLNSPLKNPDLKLIDSVTLTKARSLSLDNMKINLKKTLKEKTTNLPITPTEPGKGFKPEDQEERKDVAKIELLAIDEKNVSENSKEILVDQKNENPDSQSIDLKEEKHGADNADIKITIYPEKVTDQTVKDEKSSDTLNGSETKEDTPKKAEPITSTEKGKPVQKKEKRSSFSDLITFDQVPAMAKRTPSTESNKRERHNSASSADESKKKKREDMKSPKTKSRPPSVSKQPTEPLKLCLRRECDRVVMRGSIYCSRECIYRYANDAIRAIDEVKKRQAAVPKSPDSKQHTKGMTIISPATSSTDRVTETTQERIAVYEKSTGKIVAGVMAPTKKYLFAWLEEHPTYQILKPGKHPNTIKNPKREQDDLVRSNVRKSLRDILVNRCKDDQMAINLEALGRICIKIEAELLKLFGETGHKYKTKYRSLIFNLKDTQNKILYKRVVSGEISPRKLVSMTPEQLATPELAQWREQESRHHIEMIRKREQEEAELRKHPVVKKTYKGEVEIDAENESIPTVEVKIESEPVSRKQFSVSKKKTSPTNEVVNLLKDTTAEHNHHLFDSNCKICTGKMTPPGESQVTGVSTTVLQPEAPDSPIDSPIDDEVQSVMSPASPDTSTSVATPPSPIPTLTTAGTSAGSTTRSKQPSVWRGFIMMQKVSKFVTTAYAVSGTCDNLMEVLPDTISVCGRIPPKEVWEYLAQLKATRKNSHNYVEVIRFEMSTSEEKAGYIKLYTYFYTRQRIGVVGINHSGVKDMYILPLASHDPIPQELKPLPGLPKPRPHMLLGIIVRVKTRKTKVTEFIQLDSSPESVPKKKKKKREKKKEKELEKEKVELEAQKKLVDIIFKSRVMTQSDDGPSVDPLKLLKTITSVAELTKTTSESEQKIEPEKDADSSVDFQKIEEAQLKKIEEQQKEIDRLKREVHGSSANDTPAVKITPDPKIDNATPDAVSVPPVSAEVKNDDDVIIMDVVNPPETDEPMDIESTDDIPDTSNSLIINEVPVSDVPVNEVPVSEVPVSGLVKPIPLNENEIPLLGSNSNMSVPSSVPPSSTILPFTATSIPTKDGDDIKNTPPFVSKEFEIRVSSPDNQQDPSDEDYVSNLIGNIEMPQHMPKFPLLGQYKKDLKMPELPSIPIPGFSPAKPDRILPTSLPAFPPPFPADAPPIPLPPNIRLPPGVPFPPLPPVRLAVPIEKKEPVPIPVPIAVPVPEPIPQPEHSVKPMQDPRKSKVEKPPVQKIEELPVHKIDPKNLPFEDQPVTALLKETVAAPAFRKKHVSNVVEEKLDFHRQPYGRVQHHPEQVGKSTNKNEESDRISFSEKELCTRESFPLTGIRGFMPPHSYQTRHPEEIEETLPQPRRTRDQITPPVTRPAPPYRGPRQAFPLDPTMQEPIQRPESLLHDDEPYPERPLYQRSARQPPNTQTSDEYELPEFQHEGPQHPHRQNEEPRRMRPRNQGPRPPGQQYQGPRYPRPQIQGPRFQGPRQQGFRHPAPRHSGSRPQGRPEYPIENRDESSHFVGNTPPRDRFGDNRNSRPPHDEESDNRFPGPRNREPLYREEKYPNRRERDLSFRDDTIGGRSIPDRNRPDDRYSGPRDQERPFHREAGKRKDDRFDRRNPRSRDDRFERKGEGRMFAQREDFERGADQFGRDLRNPDKFDNSDDTRNRGSNDYLSSYERSSPRSSRRSPPRLYARSPPRSFDRKDFRKSERRDRPPRDRQSFEQGRRNYSEERPTFTNADKQERNKYYDRQGFRKDGNKVDTNQSDRDKTKDQYSGLNKTNSDNCSKKELSSSKGKETSVTRMDETNNREETKKEKDVPKSTKETDNTEGKDINITKEASVTKDTDLMDTDIDEVPKKSKKKLITYPIRLADLKKLADSQEEVDSSNIEPEPETSQANKSENEET